MNESRSDVLIHVRLPLGTAAALKPRAEGEGLRLSHWLRRTLIIAARNSVSFEVASKS